ncbi:MAG: hypothetical protein ACREXI_11100, partial [Caldimonas sp.]
VEYLVVGGYALAAHGHPRYTGDLDLWIGTQPQNIGRLLNALDSFGFGSLGLSAADFAAPDIVVQLGYPPGRIDLLTGIDGVEFESCFGRRQVVALGEVRLPIIHVDDFKINKRATGRLQDLADLQALEGGEPD